MKFKKLFDRKNKDYVTIKVNTSNVPDGLLRKCKKCSSIVLAEDVKNNNYICPKCGGYFRVHAYRRIEMVVDKDSFEPMFEGLNTRNPLKMKGYEAKVQALRDKTGLDEAVTTGRATIGGNSVAIAVCDGRFLMASMGEVVGEKIAKTVEYATKENIPVIIFACSGGARMQEGMVSLMQMAKTSAALKRHSESGNLYISVLTDPTTGGVTASFAMLGDIILAEPKALIGFAGPRVIGQKLPKGFQRSEFLLEHGFIDEIVERKDLRNRLTTILTLHKKDDKSYTDNFNIKKEKSTMAQKKRESIKMITESVKKSAWDRVLASRMNDRPIASDYIDLLFDDFVEFHGDRYFKDDQAIIGGIASFHGMPVTVNVPYSSMDDLVGGTDEFYSITVVQADKTLDSQIVADQVVHLLEKRHQCAGEDYFHVQSFQDVLQSMNEMLGMVTAFISFVAGISLLVGGIGVMNIMLVSVTERTREIGIRKSLGAKTSSIMLQFLAEAAILTVMGGVIGIILGILAGYGICSVMSGSMGMTITPGISPTVILAATLFSCAVGVFFGIYPAKKAAKLSPIEALRRN